MGNTAITVAAGASFSAHPGSNFITAGSTGTMGVGATLTLNPGTGSNPGASFDMVDGSIGTFNMQQGSGLTPALVLGGAGTAANAPSLSFEIANDTPGSIDQLIVTNDVSVGASGAAISIVPVAGATSLALGPYTFITANSGLGPTNISGITLATPVLNVGGNPYHLTLTASTPTSEILNVFTGSAFPNNAYWNGSQSGNWTTLNGDTMPASNWSTDHTGATDTNEIPGTQTNVFFTVDSRCALNLSDHAWREITRSMPA